MLDQMFIAAPVTLAGGDIFDHDHYWFMLEKDSSKVQMIWQKGHMLILSLMGAFGFASGFFFSKALYCNNGNCFLFAKISFGLDPTASKYVHEFQRALPDHLPIYNLLETRWGGSPGCNICHFAPLIACVLASVFMALFLFGSRGGAGFATDTVYQTWAIVYPCLACMIPMFIILLYSSIYITLGETAFCAQFMPVFNTTTCTGQIDNYTLLYFSQKRPFILSLYLAKLFTYFTCFFCLIKIILLFARIIFIVDFQCYLMVVYYQGIDKLILQSNLIEPPEPSKERTTFAKNLKILLKMKGSIFTRKKKQTNLNKDEKGFNLKYELSPREAIEQTKSNATIKPTYGSFFEASRTQDKDNIQIQWKMYEKLHKYKEMSNQPFYTSWPDDEKPAEVPMQTNKKQPVITLETHTSDESETDTSSKKRSKSTFRMEKKPANVKKRKKRKNKK